MAYDPGPVDWSLFSGDTPAYFEPFDIDYPVAPAGTWPTGGTAAWPDGSGPDTGDVVVIGSDDPASYDPATDILVFGFREGDAVREMNAHNYCVLWERHEDGRLTLHVMPVSIWEATTPIASIPNLAVEDLPSLVRSWVPTNNHFQDDLVASLYALTSAEAIPDNHIAVFTHEAGVATTYDYAALAAVHDEVILNFVTMTGRELDAEYDAEAERLVIRHYGEGWGGYNDVWGTTVVENVPIESLLALPQLWRRDAASEDGRMLKDRFDGILHEAAVAAGVDPGDTAPAPDGGEGHGGHDHGDMGGGATDGGATDGGATDGGGTVGTGGSTTPGAYAYDVTSSWSGGFVTEWTFTPEADTDGWQVTLAFDGTIANVWNAEVLSEGDGVVVLGNLDYNARVPAGSPTGFGFQASGSDTTVEVVDAGGGGGGDPTGPDDPTDPVDGGADPGDPDTPPVPALAVTGATVAEGGGTASGPGVIDGPLFTQGNRIVDGDGDQLAVKGVNWFGFETDIGVAHGMWTRNWKEMVDEIAATGFNLVRLPFSATAVLDPFVPPSGIDYGLNPDLVGLNSLQIMDEVIDYMGEKGLLVLLDNHRTFPGDGPNPNGRWTVDGFTEDEWVGMWEMLAARYGALDHVVGADLINEPHGATWSEFSAAAERAGDAIHAVDPDWLIFVEGVGTAGGKPYWWGGNLKEAGTDPVVLGQANKLVYSPHDYPASVFDQPWFNDGSNLIEVFREFWGYLHESGTAPVVIGEMGSRLETAKDRAWMEAITDYILGDYDRDGTPDTPGAANPGFIWWSWNPNSGDTGGILLDDWRTVDPVKLEAIRPLMEAGPDTPVAGAEGGTAVFTLSLDAASSAPVTVSFQTRDGTATAGEDYEARSGTLTFAPGETMKTVSVAILGDGAEEDDETFHLDVSAGGTAASATATILDDDEPAPPPPPPPPPEPTASVADATVDESAGLAEVDVILDEAGAGPVSLSWRAVSGTAVEGEDFAPSEGVLAIPAGETRATIAVSLVDDAAPEGNETFRVELFSADGAIIGDGAATVTVTDGDVASPPDQPEPPAPPPADGLTADLSVVNDWQSGAQVAIRVENAGSDTVEDWTLVLDVPFALGHLWGGTANLSDGVLTVDAMSWNGTLRPGEAADVGFIANDGSAFDIAAWAAATEVEVLAA